MPQADPFYEECVRVSADLDRLIADRALGRSSPARHEDHVDQAEELADRLRAIGRGPGRTINPPRYLSACGTVAGW